MSAPLIATRADAEQLLGEIANLTIDRNSMNLAMDTELTASRVTAHAPSRDGASGPLGHLGPVIESRERL
jgi:hypothetical protein